MKKLIYFIAILGAIVSFTSCTYDDSVVEPYTTGIIEFEYAKSKIINGFSTAKDTIVSFTGIGYDPIQYNDYGYFDSSISWAAMHRHNPNDFENWAGIFFTGTDLNSLKLPYKFKVGDVMNAQINYVIGYSLYYDDTGKAFSEANAYSATTYSNNFELTILSRIDNRLKGNFNGEIINYDGDKINIKNGRFDIQIIEK
ncbi:hypothetical protein [Lutibacter sp.]|uniref:hypothetical protein n=1 Tax=Lutibacter sp. TaxID=1925666 RepID=UPI0027368337|nr:hypothetical protein [Lutibacter sp.]MDP3311757.1 hypothetical protein [Lutibacter sp.]